MTEGSMLWTTSTTGDGAAAGYTQEQTIGMFERLFLEDSTAAGVARNAGSGLDATPHSGATPTVDVASGAGFVKGLFYWNTATLTLSITKPGVGDTGFRVVLRGSGGSTRTVRAAVVMSADGVSTIPTLTQDAGFPDTSSTVWDVPLFEGVVTTGGDIYTDAGKGTAGVKDDREFFDAVVKRRQGGSATTWSSFGTSEYRPRKTKMEVGCAEITGTGSWNFSDDLTITFPEAFAYTPMVLATAAAYLDNEPMALVVKSVNTTQCVLKGWRNTASSDSQVVFWLAIGPEG
jgi:hypothetical protein